MQELDVSDFFKTCRFQELGRSADFSADDPIEVALMTALLHHGADVNQADETVSFCLHFVDGYVFGSSLVKCVSEGFAATQFPASLGPSGYNHPAPPPPSPPPRLPFSSAPHPSSFSLVQWRRGLEWLHLHGLQPQLNRFPVGYQGLLSYTNSLLPGIMQGWTALHYATAANCSRAIQMLVSAGADVNAQDGKVR